MLSVVGTLTLDLRWNIRSVGSLNGISSSSSSPLADDDSREERPSREMLSVSVEVDLEATKRGRESDGQF